MSKERLNSGKIVAIIIIAIGLILIATGIVLMFNRNETKLVVTEAFESDKRSLISPEEKTSTISDELGGEEALNEEDLDIVDDPLIEEPELSFFTDTSIDVKGITFLLSDGSKTEAYPKFHQTSRIRAEVGLNPSTNNKSDILKVNMSDLLDREMSIAVLISSDSNVISGKSADEIQGLQLILTYAEKAFTKSIRFISVDGSITEQDAEAYNIRFTGKESWAEIEFFALPGTLYYAVMIYDHEFFTLILPENDMN